MIQNTLEWEQWRREGVGASDSPIIMGESKYLTPFDLFQIKLGLKEHEANEFITNLGHRFEPRVRAHINLLMDWDYEPQVVEHETYPWLRASLDGWNGHDPMEVKYVGQKKYNDAFDNDEIDPTHWIQMQHQMMITGSEVCTYVFYTLAEYKEVDDISIKYIYYDEEYVNKKLWPELCKFWERVIKKEWPDEG